MITAPPRHPARSGEPGLRVLIVESSDEIRERLVRLTSELDAVDAAQAGSAELALSLLSGPPFDVVALDVDLAGGRGLDTLAQVHRGAPGSILIALGSERDPDLSERCRQLGADLYFVISREFMCFRAVIEALVQGP